MPMQKKQSILRPGFQFQSEAGNSYRVLEYVACGSQGEIYKVESGSGNILALKYYFPRFAASSHLYEDISELVSLKKNPDDRFVWPQELMRHADSFGYLMRYADLSKTKTIFQDDELLERELAAKVCLNIARAMQALHLRGLCYKDLSPNNFEYDPQTGAVVIFDCDNINPKGTKCTVSGTPGYRAPEIVLGKKYPDDYSDLFSMAVIFFKIWMGADCAPLEGKRLYTMFDGILESDIISRESRAETYLYGTDPLFIFHPTDSSNALDAQDETDAGKLVLWQYFIPQNLKKLFTDTFTTGLLRPALRPTDGRWALCFEQVLRDIKPCPGCRKNNIMSLPYCFDCGRALDDGERE